VQILIGSQNLACRNQATATVQYAKWISVSADWSISFISWKSIQSVCLWYISLKAGELLATHRKLCYLEQPRNEHYFLHCCHILK